MRIRENLGGLTALATKNKIPTSTQKVQMGRVVGVITTKNTPNKELFEKYNGYSGVGTIFYIDYSQSSNVDINTVDLNKCKVAQPLLSGVQSYPLIGEVVQIIDGPSPVSQVSNTATQKYYTGTVNIWNDVQQNSPSTGQLGKTFIESSDIRRLVSFEGDTIYQGRKGNGIRFGSTVKQFSDINEWSDVGDDGDPITIMVNGYVTTDNGSLSPNIEEINKEKSSIYLTTTQKIPLLPSRTSNPNPLTSPIKPDKYFSPQIILNSDRITLNSKKDEVMIFAKTNVEITTDNIINLNAGGRTHINSPIIFLGTKSDGTAPTEPLLLGNKTVRFLNQLLSLLGELGNNLSSTITPPPGSPLVGVNIAGSSLSSQIQSLQQQLKDITSINNYTT